MLNYRKNKSQMLDVIYTIWLSKKTLMTNIRKKTWIMPKRRDLFVLI